MSNFKCQISNSNDNGFTLIELLVVFAILFITTIVGIASFLRYGTSQILESSAAEVESFLNNARANASTQTFPPPFIACVSPLQKYSVRITSDNSYEMDVYCNGVRSTIKTKTLPNGAAFTLVPNEVFFLAGSGSSEVAGSITINGTYGSKQITIDSAGNITKL